MVQVRVPESDLDQQADVNNHGDQPGCGDDVFLFQKQYIGRVNERQ